MNEHLLTAEELAEVLGVNRDTVLRLARAGTIPCIRMTARLVRFDKDKVLAALNQKGEPAMSVK
jgi:excisionase family DNA binding protein